MCYRCVLVSNVHLMPALAPWNALLPSLQADAGAISEQEGGSGDPSQVEALWSVVVEGGLLTSSHERKFLACQIFQVGGCACM
jgi:hypothetical protein